MRDIAQLRALSAGELADLFRAAVLLTAIALTLRRKGLRGVEAALRRIQPGCTPDADAVRSAWRARQTARVVAAAARRAPFRATCLARSLTLQWILKRRGIHTDLRLGVRKVSGRFEAHAWLEHDGEPLMESVDVGERFAPFKVPHRNLAR
ncbi:MAG: lasso peptide biosynthesis B2 protein [Candidatus Eisenbacteria bacterium]